MYIGQWTQAWQPVHRLRFATRHRIILHQVFLRGIIHLRTVFYQVLPHRVAFCHVFFRFHDAGIFVLSYEAIDHFPDRAFL